MFRTDHVNVDVYQFACDPYDAHLRAADSVLSPMERARFARMISPWRERSIIARANLRHLLSDRLGIGPRDVSFEYGEHGKPSLARKFRADISFSIARSANVAAIAISEDVSVGVDLEEIKDDIDHDLLVGELLSPRELAVFRRLPADKRRAAFYRAWTCKEAFIKATGEGMSRPFTSFEVAFEHAAGVRIIEVPREWSWITWSLVCLNTFPGFAGSLAAGTSQITIQYHETPTVCAP